jgi:hypothetical protein
VTTVVNFDVVTDIADRMKKAPGGGSSTVLMSSTAVEEENCKVISEWTT